MKNSSNEIHDLRAKDDKILRDSAQVQQILAQLEADLSRKENQRVKEKSKKT